jgi:hypothetical protein
VLLVVDVTNLGDRPASGLTVANQASNLVVANPLWGGCEAAPCPPFAIAGLKQKQITLPVTITDAGQPIFDVVTVSGEGVARQAVVRVAPRWTPWAYVLGGLALLGAGAAAWRLWPRPTPPGAPNWPALITAQGVLDAAQEARVGEVKLAAPPVSVRARMDPGETRFAGPIPLGPPPDSPASGRTS